MREEGVSCKIGNACDEGRGRCEERRDEMTKGRGKAGRLEGEGKGWKR